MGYRSEIAFCITVDQVMKEDEQGSKVWDYDKDKFKEMIGFFKLTKFYEVATGEEYNLVKGKEPCLGWKDGVIMFYASQWKWYDGYSIVDACYEMWESMQSIEGISGYYVRTGEEAGDTEELQFGDAPDTAHFGIYTGVSFDGGEYLGEATTEETGDEPTKPNNVSNSEVAVSTL